VVAVNDIVNVELELGSIKLSQGNLKASLQVAYNRIKSEKREANAERIEIILKFVHLPKHQPKEFPWSCRDDHRLCDIPYVFSQQ
jgi:hypothetical protein